MTKANIVSQVIPVKTRHTTCLGEGIRVTGWSNPGNNQSENRWRSSHTHTGVALGGSQGCSRWLEMIGLCSDISTHPHWGCNQFYTTGTQPSASSRVCGCVQGVCAFKRMFKRVSALEITVYSKPDGIWVWGMHKAVTLASHLTAVHLPRSQREITLNNYSSYAPVIWLCVCGVRACVRAKPKKLFVSLQAWQHYFSALSALGPENKESCSGFRVPPLNSVSGVILIDQ